MALVVADLWLIVVVSRTELVNRGPPVESEDRRV
jgi:hypothetical protein